MPKSLTGSFLISAKHLRDPSFYRTVVLMVEHNKDGAMGLIVNRPSQVTVSRALKGHFELPDTGDVVFTGGPVEKAALFILHNSEDFDGNESPVVPGLYVGNSAHVFEDIVLSASEGHAELKFRIFAGCAGWSPEQLEGEISRGDWLTFPASTDMIFHKDPYAIWDLLCHLIARQGDFLPSIPSDPELN
ncbi:MAG: YqgE/AlgH family protein [Planctomycetota bacterium]